MMKKHDSHENKDQTADRESVQVEQETAASPSLANSAAAGEAKPAAVPDGQQDRDETEQDPELYRNLKESLLAREKDFAVLSDKYLRLMAEYDNFRRRSQKEKESLYADSVTSVVKEWLPVLDSIDLADMAARQYETEEARQIAAGLAKIQKQVDDVLDHLCVEEIECVGQSFNPDLHEAVMHVEDETVGASMVVEEFQKGYCRKDRVIRHSVVKVAN